jgi:hypothetical protein
MTAEMERGAVEGAKTGTGPEQRGAETVGGGAGRIGKFKRASEPRRVGKLVRAGARRNGR